MTVSNVDAQTTRKVLFLGNSYTGVNNLPQLVHDVALSTGDTLIFDSNTPGGYQLINHWMDATSKNKIMAGGWDYIVLQGQSQEPIAQNSDFRNGIAQLNTLILQYDPCSVLMFYMTWGRKNGDLSSACNYFPVICTYDGMDTTLRNEYLDVTSRLKAEVSPVSMVWRYLRQNHPGIELYQPDESHPSVAGSYAAACCFYATIFKKDPTLISFNPGLPAADAAVIRSAVKTQVFDHLNLWDYSQPPASDFLYTIGTGVNEFIFNPVNNGYHETYFWNLGDGTTSTSSYSQHSYAASGTYTVSLTTTFCDLQGLHSSTSDTVIQICNHTPTIYTSHPWLCQHDTLWTQAADSYQWFHQGMPIPETDQFVDFRQYGSIGSFYVISTVNGCSEMSTAFSENADWSGYYFDAISTTGPCEGGTAPFAVLHTNGSLPGSEIIQWYMNDTLLPWANNEDTLFITTGGTYECQVVNPNSNCPLDTTYSVVTFNCGAVGMEDNIQDPFWNVFPNPASESITIEFANYPVKEQLEIYSAIGRTLKIVETAGTTSIDIADLPDGLYFIRLKNNKQHPVKFIKQ
jgi:PKD repeat protein